MLVETCLRQKFVINDEIHALLDKVLESSRHFSANDEEAGDTLIKNICQIASEISVDDSKKNLFVVICDVLLKYRKEALDGFSENLVCHFERSLLFPFDDAMFFLTKLIFKMSSLLVNYRERIIYGLTTLIQARKSESDTIRLFRLIKDKTFRLADAMPNLQEKGILIKSFMSQLNGQFDEEYFRFILEMYTTENFKQTELTSILQPCFLRAFSAPLSIRMKFIDLYEKNIRRNSFARLYYLIGRQSWSGITEDVFSAFSIYLIFINQVAVSYESVKLEDPKKILLLIQADGKRLFEDVFPQLWSQFTSVQRVELSKAFVSMFGTLSENRTLEYADMSSVLSTLVKLKPHVKLPPFLLANLKSFDTLFYLQEMFENGDFITDRKTKFLFANAFGQLLRKNKDYDLLLGLDQQQSLTRGALQVIELLQKSDYENAQIRIEECQSNLKKNINLSPHELHLYKDEWLYCAKELQQWEVIEEVSQHEGWDHLLFESQFHTLDFASDEKAKLKIPIDLDFKEKAFLCCHYLVESFENELYLSKFKSLIVEVKGMLLTAFTVENARLYVELLEFQNVLSTLSKITNVTTAVEMASQLNVTCSYFRQILPNDYEDVSHWTELITIRKYIFNIINRKYSIYLPNMQSMVGNNGQNALAFKGFHELAWTFNRLAKVYRKRDLHEHCINTLNLVYSLPNIELQEAFLKLKEQAKLYLKDPDLAGNGLELIKTTNTHYFSTANKAEFLVFKGRYLEVCNREPEAAEAFMSATTTDPDFPKGWSYWARFHLKQDLTSDIHLKNAIICFVNALICKEEKIRFKDATLLLWLLTTNIENPILKECMSNADKMGIHQFMHHIPELLHIYKSKYLKDFAHQLLIKLFKARPAVVFPYLILKEKDRELQALLSHILSDQPIIFQSLSSIYQHFININSECMKQTGPFFKSEQIELNMPSLLRNFEYGSFAEVTVPCFYTKHSIYTQAPIIVNFKNLRSVHNKQILTLNASNGLDYQYEIEDTKCEYPYFRTSQGYWKVCDYFTKKSLDFLKRKCPLPTFEREYLKQHVVMSLAPENLYLSEFASSFEGYTKESEFHTLVEKYKTSIKFGLSTQLNSRKYWEFRKKFTYSYSILNASIFALNLNPLSLEDFTMSLVDGKCFSKENLFSLQRSTETELIFRLTPAIQEFISVVGIQGYFKQMIIIFAKAMVGNHEFLQLFLPVSNPVEESRLIDSKFITLSRHKIDDILSISTNPRTLYQLEKEFYSFF
eukprot:NODE_125_length_17255_cov_0.877827.p2 type:complete len:1250 gc:universal NODE_125_length_17255_cov_0.877827:8090-11839(+)